MAVYRKLIAFDRPLASATITGGSTKRYSESEAADLRVSAYQEGADAARAFGNQQLVEFRAEVQALQEGLFARLSESEATMYQQVRESLPALVVEVARRLLAGFEPAADQVQKLCADTLEQLYPESENLELLVCSADAALLEKISPAWKAQYPGLRVTVSPTLSPGDCQVRSRFGITDARLSAKLETLSRELGVNA
ncbi:MAG TPA: FliH/SctL family protein [Opitutaceae bacterium]|nr:FliH/SctL family protein [Opitutaceae bacterium]